jgi:hypothetical protein
MAEDIPLKERMNMLYAYGFRLNPSELFKNKTGSIILHRAPSAAVSNNIHVMLDGIAVGYYSEGTGKFVYSGGSALQEAFPPKRINAAFADLLRRHLDKDQGEYGDKGLPVKYDRHPYCNEFQTLYDALGLLGLFIVEQKEWDLGWFQVQTFHTGSIVIHKKSNMEVLAIITKSTFEVYSNRVSDEIVGGVLRYLLKALGDHWKASEYTKSEPSKWNWADAIKGVRYIPVDWLAWHVFVSKTNHRDIAFVAQMVDEEIKIGAYKVCRELEKEHGAQYDTYKAKMEHGTRNFTVYTNNPITVF